MYKSPGIHVAHLGLQKDSALKIETVVDMQHEFSVSVRIFMKLLLAPGKNT